MSGTHNLPSIGFPTVLKPSDGCGHPRDKLGLSFSLQAEEDKEEQTDSQPDASSSQTVTPVAEPPSAEPTPPDGPTSLGPLDLLPSEELLTDTSNSSSSKGEEGEAGGPTRLLWLYETDFTQTG